MARRPDPDARQRILDTATRLFDTHGVHAVGLQQIIDELGCGKNLLYREFATKDDLVVAYLRQCRDTWSSMIASATAPLPDDPAGQLVAIVRATVQHATAPGYRGCPVHNAHAEFPNTTHPAHPVAVEHFTAVQDLLLRPGQARRRGDSEGAGRPARADHRRRQHQRRRTGQPGQRHRRRRVRRGRGPSGTRPVEARSIEDGGGTRTNTAVA